MNCQYDLSSAPQRYYYIIFSIIFIREFQKAKKLPCCVKEVFNEKKRKEKKTPSGVHNLLALEILDLFLINSTLELFESNFISKYFSCLGR